jgi:DNA-binding CsgD family transcriptional regulator
VRGELRAREVEVLALVAQTWSNEEIAGRLGIGVETGKTYVVNVLAVVGARNRAHAAAIGVRRGLIRWDVALGLLVGHVELARALRASANVILTTAPLLRSPVE